MNQNKGYESILYMNALKCLNELLIGGEVRSKVEAIKLIFKELAQQYNVL